MRVERVLILLSGAEPNGEWIGAMLPFVLPGLAKRIADPPVSARHMLVRERLLDRLRARWVHRLTVMSAAAGYGKTTVLAQAVATNAAAPVGIDRWLTCDASSRVASSLGQALCRAVEAPAPKPGCQLGELAAAVSDAVWRLSPQQVTLIVDDVQEIQPETEAAALLATVVATLPDNGHVVLSGRCRPSLPLARLELEGQLVLIEQVELAFTDSEVTEFAALRQVSEERMAGCGGWPALAELTAGSRVAVAGRYVDQEILPDWPVERRRALALLAHLGHVDEALAHAVVGAEVDVHGLVAGVPLVHETGEAEDSWWSVHSLWRSWLASEVTRADVASVRRLAARVMLERGEIGSAVEHLIEAEAWDEVGDAIVEALGAANPPAARDVLAAWLARLPTAVRTTPHGQLLSTMITAFEGDLEPTWLNLERCAADFRAAGNLRGELASLVQLGLLAWWTEDLGRLAPLAARVLELEAQGCDAAVPLACIARALVCDIAGNSPGVLAELDRIPPGSLGEVWQGIVSWIRMMSVLQIGHAAEAVEAADDARARVGSMYPAVAGSRLQAVWYLGRAAEVLEALPDMYQEIKQSGSHRHVALAAAQCSVGHSLVGQVEPAARYLGEARRSAQAAAPGSLVESSLAFAEAMAAVVGGDEAAAAVTLHTYIEHHPADRGLYAGFQRRHLPLLYVLVPETRDVWDNTDLGPTWHRARDLARAIVATREEKPLPPATPLDDVALVQAHLPPPWVGELGVAAIAAGREQGWRLLDETWPTTRQEVAALARRRGRTPLRTAARTALSRLPAPPSRPLSLRLLGAMQLTADGTPVQSPDWRRERVRLLLAHLALHTTVNRTQLAEDLWPSLDTDAQSRNLRVTLTYLLRVLEPDRGSREPSYFLRQDGANLTLHAGDWLTVDLWDFDTRLTEASEAERRAAPPQTILSHALTALELWPNTPSDLASEEWAVRDFERRHVRVASLAIRAGELLLARGEVDQALSLAERGLEVDPWNEAAHRLIVATHQTRGDELAARHAVQQYRHLLDELGLDPHEETLMVERLLDGARRAHRTTR